MSNIKLNNLIVEDHLTLKYALKKINLSTAGVCFVTKKKRY